jgi:hypothetical protein
MKKNILFVSLLLITITGFSQSKEYSNAMGEALKQYSICKTVDEFQATGNRFLLIANVEKSEWLPLYYHAHCFIIMSFMDQTDAAAKDNYLDIAEKSVAKMIEIAPKESEVYALQSLLYTARLVIDPISRGQQYSALSVQAAGMSLSFDASNPRAKLIKLRNDLGTAKFFGKDPKEFCPQATALLADWDNYKLKSPLHPRWGKNQVEEIVAGCK